MRVCNAHVSRNITGPPGPDDLLTSERSLASPITVLTELIDRYGDFVGYRTQFGQFYLVNEPALVQQVLYSPDFVRNRLIKMVLGDGVLSSNGPHWEQQRRLMLPVFKPRQMESLVGIFRSVTEDRVQAWAGMSGSTKSTTLDIVPEMFRIALDNVGRGLFGTVFDDAFLHAADSVMWEVSAIQNATMFGFPLVRRASSHRQYQTAMDVMEQAAASLQARHQKQPCPAAKLLNILQPADPCDNDDPLAARQVRDEILTMITAGHETTAVSLCWALYAIATHPRVAERFYDEIDEVLNGRSVRAADLPRLKYTRMLIDETLRIYPPVWVVARTTARDVRLGGYEIPAGSGVLVSPYALHRHPQHWSHPDRFDPERFREEAGKPDHASYIPFLAGRHLCLGKHFALTEIVVVLATLAQRYRFQLPRETSVEIEPLVSLRVRGGLPLTVVSRRAGGAAC